MQSFFSMSPTITNASYPCHTGPASLTVGAQLAWHVQGPPEDGAAYLGRMGHAPKTHQLAGKAECREGGSEGLFKNYLSQNIVVAICK